MQPSRTRSGFTLIELLTVIAIIAVLMGLLLPAISSAKNSAKKVTARSDLSQLVTAVKAFYTDYGVYPIDPTLSQNASEDAEFGDPGDSAHPIADVVNVLRAATQSGVGIQLTSGTSTSISINTRQTPYLDIPYVKDPANPKSGLGNGQETSQYKGGTEGGTWYDPWGGSYIVIIDANYDNYTQALTLGSYTDITYSQDPTGAKAVQTGCIGASLGSDHQMGTNGNNIYNGSDDVLSWQ